jgi:hypothetical protein
MFDEDFTNNNYTHNSNIDEFKHYLYFDHSDNMDNTLSLKSHTSAITSEQKQLEMSRQDYYKALIQESHG